MQEKQQVEVPLSLQVPKVSEGGFDRDTENNGSGFNADSQQCTHQVSAEASARPEAAVLARHHVTVEDVQLDADELQDALVRHTYMSLIIL
jgi:hypothetical protein